MQTGDGRKRGYNRQAMYKGHSSSRSTERGVMSPKDESREVSEFSYLPVLFHS